MSFAVVGILIPTLIHVSLFTLVFMTLGAIKAKSRVQAALVIVYLVAIAAILLAPPTAEIRIASFAKAAQDYFGNVGPALSRLFGIPGLQLDVRLTSLLAFAYTYHYLNWFIKADVIRWADIPRSRLALVIAASAASTALYFYDYAFGFTFLLALSLVHILLEFPLDSLALRQLGTAMGSGLRGSFRGAVTAAPRSRPASSKASKPRWASLSDSFLLWSPSSSSSSRFCGPLRVAPSRRPDRSSPTAMTRTIPRWPGVTVRSRR